MPKKKLVSATDDKQKNLGLFDFQESKRFFGEMFIPCFLEGVKITSVGLKLDRPQLQH